MSDLIDRQTAITRIDRIMPSKTDSDYKKGISVGMAMAKIAIKDQPSVQPEPRWIPVTERLPEEAQDVLVTVNDGAIYVETDYFTGAHFLKFWDDTTAWMPLPEPYRLEGGEADV